MSSQTQTRHLKKRGLKPAQRYGAMAEPKKMPERELAPKRDDVLVVIAKPSQMLEMPGSYMTRRGFVQASSDTKMFDSVHEAVVAEGYHQMSDTGAFELERMSQFTGTR